MRGRGRMDVHGASSCHTLSFLWWRFLSAITAKSLPLGRAHEWTNAWCQRCYIVAAEQQSRQLTITIQQTITTHPSHGHTAGAAKHDHATEQSHIPCFTALALIPAARHKLRREERSGRIRVAPRHTAHSGLAPRAAICIHAGVLALARARRLGHGAHHHTSIVHVTLDERCACGCMGVRAWGCVCTTQTAPQPSPMLHCLHAAGHGMDLSEKPHGLGETAYSGFGAWTLCWPQLAWEWPRYVYRSVCDNW